jgi:hypothetical protein
LRPELHQDNIDKIKTTSRQFHDNIRTTPRQHQDNTQTTPRQHQDNTKTRSTTELNATKIASKTSDTSKRRNPSEEACKRITRTPLTSPPESIDQSYSSVQPYEPRPQLNLLLAHNTLVRTVPKTQAESLETGEPENRGTGAEEPLNPNENGRQRPLPPSNHTLRSLILILQLVLSKQHANPLAPHNRHLNSNP